MFQGRITLALCDAKRPPRKRLRPCRLLAQNASFLAFHTANLDSWLLAQNLVSVLRRTGSADSAEALAQLLCEKSWPLEGSELVTLLQLAFASASRFRKAASP